MPRPRRPPGAGPALTILTLLLLPSLLVAAQQQQPLEHHARNKSPSAGPRVEHARNIPHQHHRKNSQEGAYTPVLAENERALATKVSSAPAISAVRARHGAGAASGVLTSSARSLQDWEVEDFVLLATVDGHIHARDRYNGEEIWEIAGKPMLKTTYNGSEGEARLSDQSFVWIVEPREDGALYVLSPGPFPVLQSLGLTVKQLTEIAPFSSDDPELPVVYNVEKRTIMLNVDAATGFVKQSFSPSGVYGDGKNDDSCAVQVKNVFNERDCRGTFEIGQTEYTIIIHNKKTNEHMCTIKYAEWASNNRDFDLKSQYTKTMDDQYIYGRFNGEVFAVDHKRPRPGKRPLFIRNLPYPVARVFDVARPAGDDSAQAPLVLLPQPAGPTILEEKANQVWLNTTETGAWYALSERSYPAVTDGAPMAACYNDDSLLGRDLSHSLPTDEKTLVGVHVLNHQFEPSPSFQAIAAPTQYQLHNGQDYSLPPSSSPMQRPTIDGPPPIMEMRPSHISTSQILLLAVVMILSVSIGKWMGPGKLAPVWSHMWDQVQKLRQPSRKGLLPPVPTASPAEGEAAKEQEHAPHIADEITSPEKSVEEPEEETTEKPQLDAPFEPDLKEKKVVTFDIPEEEEDLSLSRTTTVEQGSPAEEGEALTTVDSNPEASSKPVGTGDSPQDPNAPATPKKKKTHRGKRGGRKLSRAQKDDDEVGRIVDAAKQLDPTPGLHPKRSP